MTRSAGAALVFVAVLTAACGPAGGRGPQTAAGNVEVRQDRALSLVLRGEPTDLTSNCAGRCHIIRAMFTAPLVNAERGLSPVLGDVPQLGTDTWRVFSDGRMTTTYRLKPGLLWHDGAPLSAQDFVFARRVDAGSADLGLPPSSSVEARAIDEVLSPEPNVLVIRWSELYGDADSPILEPLPRHLLEAPLEAALGQRRGDLLFGHSYWTDEFAGLGPYRLARWQHGAFLEATAFDGYALGRPKIDKILVTWSTDPNVTLARLLAGDSHLTMDEGIDFQQAVHLRREWSRTGGGVVTLAPVQNRYLGTQFRPAYSNPRALLDVRVRKASLHAIDREAVAHALLEGEGVVAETFAFPTEPFYDALYRVMEKYPHDLRRTEELMRDAGFTRGADGVYASPDEGRFAPEVLGVAEGVEGLEATAVTDYFRRAGIDAQLRLLPSSVLSRDNELKSTYPAFRGNQAMLPERITTSGVASAENRWSAVNKTGYSDPEHDRLYDLWTKTLEQGERDHLQIQMYKGMNDNLPGLPLYYNYWVIAHSADLEGPLPRLPQYRSSARIYGNLYQWRWVG